MAKTKYVASQGSLPDVVAYQQVAYPEFWHVIFNGTMLDISTDTGSYGNSDIDNLLEVLNQIKKEVSK